MEIKPLIEALLFVTEEPLPPAKIAEILAAELQDVRKTIKELQQEYATADHGLQIMEIAKGYQFATKPELAPVVEKLFKGEKSYTLSQAALETLAIIAYRQPVTRVDIEAIRGVKVDAVINTLQKRRLIRTVGRKDAPGRPLLYGTTKEFLKYFGLKDLSELPRLAESDEQY
ncbi:MAG TPA: SMC-Scp complex subunit ScpB [Firmicutes bacterium]|jgi:segregation and condensation protein B|nr:SMC-Scp complex subunit ScpB [Bacillota bacterium]HAA38310.1 SMC-Scp complex subunit ScpB [Bacillota bacterium]